MAASQVFSFYHSRSKSGDSWISSSYFKYEFSTVNQRSIIQLVKLLEHMLCDRSGYGKGSLKERERKEKIYLWARPSWSPPSLDCLHSHMIPDSHPFHNQGEAAFLEDNQNYSLTWTYLIFLEKLMFYEKDESMYNTARKKNKNITASENILLLQR